MGQLLQRTALMAVACVALASGAMATSPITAIVEDIQAPATNLQFMDYVSRGQVIVVGEKGTITLSYFESCLHETIVGGFVIVGASQSKVSGGMVERTKVDCDRGTLVPAGSSPETAANATTQRSDDSAALLMRSLGPGKKAGGGKPMKKIFGLSPVFKLSWEVEEIRITDGLIPPTEIVVSVSGRHADLTQRKIVLKPGRAYTARAADDTIMFYVDPSAKPGRVPLLSRLLRF